METRVGLKITFILLVMTVCSTAKRKHFHKQKHDPIKTSDESLTAIFMGDRLRDNETRDNKSTNTQHNASSIHSVNSSRDGKVKVSPVVTLGVDVSHNKTKAFDKKKTINQGNTTNKHGQSFLSTLTKKHTKHPMQINKDKLRNKSKGSHTHRAITRENIADDINKIDDVQNLYHQGLRNDDTMEKVKQIDSGELTDYFHALNGENEAKTDGSHHDDEQQHDEERQSLKFDNESMDEEETGNQKIADSNVGPGYEVFSDNPEEIDTDDFYDTIAQGKKPEVKMKKLRPTKSHFGDKRFPTERQDVQHTNVKKPSHQRPHDDHNQKKEPLAKPSDDNEVQNNEEPDPDFMDYPYPIDGPRKKDPEHEVVKQYTSEPIEKTAEHEDSGPYMHSPIEKTAEHEDSSPYVHGPMKATAEHETTKQNTHGPSQATAEHEDGEHQQIGPSGGNSNSSTTNSKEYADKKEGHIEETSDGYNPFLNQMFNPFNIFEFNKKQPVDSKQNSSSSPLLSSKVTKTQDTVKGMPNQQTKKLTSTPLKIKGTRIQGGKITGGTITGGVIEGGEITAGHIEGGMIKGGHVEGGKFKNGTMEGGVLHDGLFEGGHLINGSFEGGSMKGGYMYGGQVRGGSIDGGNIKGGVLLGGQFHGGSLEGGVMKGGEIHGGSIKGGNMEGGIMTGGSMEGGVLKFGKLSGGTIKAGSMLGGEMTNGSIDGGVLKGGSISGGVLKGGVMEGGQLKGGVVLAGKIKGGIIEGGVIEGGEINDGVIIKGGRINGTILAIKDKEKNGDKDTSKQQNEKEGRTEKNDKNEDKKEKEDNKEKEQHKSVDESSSEIGSLPPVIMKEPKHIEITQASSDSDTQQPQIIDDINNVHNGASSDTHINQQTPIPIYVDPKVPPPSAYSDYQRPNHLNSPTGQPYVQTTGQSRNLTPAKGGKHHIVFDGISFDIPEEGFSDFIRRINSNDLLSELANHADYKTHEDLHDNDITNKANHKQETEIKSPKEAESEGVQVVEKTKQVESKILKEDENKIKKEDENNLVNEGENKVVKENENRIVKEVESKIVNEDENRVVKEDENKRAKEVENKDDNKVAKEDENKIVNENENKIVNENENKMVKEEENKMVKEEENKMVKEDENKIVKEDENKVVNEAVKENEHRSEASEIKPEDIEVKLSPTKSEQKNDTKDQHPMMSWATKPLTLKPNYHWSLSNIMGDRIPGSPGAAIITHGHIFKTRGGLAFNGDDAWLGAGDFAGGCISAPDKCEDGFSFEMTLKIDKNSLLNSNDMRYIVDSGASTFNSKGFSLYTLHGKIRADVAIPNDSICLESPLEADRWQDVLVTWRKDKGLKMYLNCELKGQASTGEQCLGCRSPGCHTTDVNTQLMIGRPNYSPHFHCTKFESGDISFWEKYLDDDDIKVLCGRDAESQSTTSTPPTQTPQSYVNYPINDQQTQQQTNQQQGSQQQTNQQQDSQQLTNQQQDNQQETNQQQDSQQQTNQQPDNPMTSYPAPYPSPSTEQSPSTFYSPLVGYMKPGKLYQFTQYIPAMSPSPSYTGNQMYSGYYPASAPASSTSDTVASNLLASQPSYVPGANRSPQPRLTSSSIVNQYFTPWSSWSACSETCGYGVRARTRTCQNPQILLGGLVCSGPSVQHGFCFMKACPGSSRVTARKNLVKKILRDLVKDFTLRESKKIPLKSAHLPAEPKKPRVYSTKSRTTSKHPAPRKGKRRPLKLVPEKTAVEHATNRNVHAVDGRYGNWSPWGQCDRSCGRGAQVRTRLCNNPPPSIMGRSCIAFGPSVQVRRCNIVPCPVDGGFSSWSKFSDCSKTCGPGGVQFRIRTCSNPSPSFGGKPCVGPGQETKPCLNYRPCIVPPRYSAWAPWSGCDADCGGGVRERMRQCIYPPGSSGESCLSLGPNRITELCNLTPCDG